MGKLRPSLGEGYGRRGRLRDRCVRSRGIVGFCTFWGCWIYAIATYGWFLGLGVGWIPSLFIAYIFGLLAGVLWPLLLLGMLAILYMSFKH
jgi:hypothetical protein